MGQGLPRLGFLISPLTLSLFSSPHCLLLLLLSPLKAVRSTIPSLTLRFSHENSISVQASLTVTSPLTVVALAASVDIRGFGRQSHQACKTTTFILYQCLTLWFFVVFHLFWRFNWSHTITWTNLYCFFSSGVLMLNFFMQKNYILYEIIF